MATRLLQSIAFTNVAPAGVAVLPHQLNINGIPCKPDLVGADATGFTIIATATTVTVTNNNVGAASVNVWLERKHSIPRELGGLANLSPQPFVLAAGGSGGGSTPSAIFQWNVGVPWATVYAAMQALTGPKICLVEYDPATDGARTVTNNGGVPQDFNNIFFQGLSGAPSDGTTATLVFDDGIQFAPGPEGVRLASQDVGWNFGALTAPAYVGGGATWTTFNMTGGRLDGSNTAGVAAFDGTLWLVLRDVHAGGGNVGRCTDSSDELWLRAGTRVFNPIFIDDGGGNGLAVFADASCQWSAAGLIANGLFVSPMEVTNYAKGTGSNLYSISVDGGGNVIASLVP